MPSLQDVIVGKLALKRDLVSAQALMQCVGEQRDGSTLGQVLVRRQLISPSSLVELIQTAERAELACPRCHQGYMAGSLDPRNGTRCPRCAGTLTMVLDGEELSDRFTTGRTARMHRDDLPPHLFTRPDLTPPTPSVGHQTVTGSKRFAAPGRTFTGTFGHYEILEELGRGGMGVVYKARQPNLERFVALKILLAGELASENQIKRFHREAEIAARLKHPGIVQIHDVGRIGEFHYFTMDFVDGDPLSTLIKGRRLGIRRAVEITRDIARALEHAHQRGAIHRDVKPANILIDREGQAVITDFGLARDLDGDDQRLTKTGAVVGTPYYMSPEQARGARDLIGPLSDVYSLGVVLFESLTFQLPFRAETQLELTTLILTQDAPRPTSIEPAIDREVETIVLKTLGKELRDRYQSAGELADDLERYLRGEPILARRPGPVELLVRGIRRHSGVVSGVTAALLLLTGGFVALRAYVASIHAGASVATPSTATDPPPPPPPPSQAAQLLQSFDQALAEAKDCHGGELYRRTLEKAIRLAGEALALPEHKDSARILLARAAAHQRIGREPDAAADFRKVADLDTTGPAGAEAMYRLIRLRMHGRAGTDPTPEILEELSRACRNRSGAAAGAWGEILAALQSLLRDQDPQTALSRLLKARSLDPQVAEAHYLEAMARVQAATPRDLEEAERALDRARSIDDKDSMIWFTLAKLHANQGHLNQALDDLGRALDLEPGLVEALQIRAQIHLALNRPEPAVTDLRLALERSPDDKQTTKNLVRLLMQLPGREGEVDALLQRLERIAPEEPTPHLMRVNRAIEEGRVAEAVQHQLRAQSRAPAKSEVRERLTDHAIDLALTLGQEEQIERRADELLRAQADDPEGLYIQISLTMIRGGQEDPGPKKDELLQRARDLLARALLRHPREYLVRKAELNIALRLSDSTDVAQVVTRFEKDFSTDPRALAYLAKLLAIAKDDFRQAEELARRALSMDRSCTEALGTLGHIALLSKQPEDAKRLAIAALQASPIEDAQWYHLIGAAEVRLRRHEAATEAFRTALGIDPFNENNAMFLVQTLMDRDMHREAINFARSWLSLYQRCKVPIYGPMVRLMAECHTAIRDYPTAAQLLEDIATKVPDPEVILDLVQVYGEWGKLDRARQLVEQVLQHDPNNRRAQELKRRLGG